MERLKINDDHVGLVVGTKQCTAVHDGEANNACRHKNALVYAVDQKGDGLHVHHRVIPLL